MRPRRFWYEFDLVAELAFREFRYAPPRDGLPFDAASTYAEAAGGYPAFEAEPFDLERNLATFTWPAVVLSGRHDLRTPPAIARRAHSLLPESVLVMLDDGHSILDEHPLAALGVMARVHDGRSADLVAETALLNDLPATGPTAALARLVTVAVRLGL